MENSYLNFIGYENQDFFPKIEMGLEECQSYSLMRDDGQAGFSYENDSQQLLFSNQKATNLIHNIFDVAYNPNQSMNTFEKPRKHPPFKIIRQDKQEKKEETSTSDETSVSVPITDKLADKSRRIIKREKARQRNNVKNAVLTPSISIVEIPQKYLPEGFNQSNLDEKSKKKMVQMIRNRISAQNSRDRKKAYMKKLETHQKKMASENFQSQKEIIQLKQMNEALKLECEYLRRALMSTISETHDKISQDEEASKEATSDLNCELDFEMSPELKSGSCIRKQAGSAHIIKYSLALATLFTVLMFSNISLQNGNSAPKLSQLGQQLSTLESQLEEAFFSYKRKLEEDSIERAEMLRDCDNIKIEVEQDPQDLPDLNTALKPPILHEIEELKKLRNVFMESYMPKVINQMKINSSEGFEAKNDISLPEYLKQSLERNAGGLDEGANRDNHSALFCPSGFVVQSTEKERRETNFNVKLEEGFQSDSKKKFTMKDTEWLQLIVPKSNLFQTTLEGQDKVKIAADQGCRSEDNSLVEFWCKIVNIRTLQSSY